LNFDIIFVSYNLKAEWEKSFTSKVVNVVTKSVPSSGKSSPMNTELTQLVPITETQIFNSKESTSTSMKQLVEDTSQELFLWILNQEQWTPLELDHSVNSSDQTTSFSDKVEPVTTGPRVTTLKELNWSIQSSMLPERKLKDVIVFKDSKSPTHWEVEQDQVWVPSLFQKSEKNIPTESWKLSQLSHHQKSLIPSLNHTTPPSQSINWLKTLMSAWLSITKLFMIFASEPLSWPLQPMVILTIWSQLLCQVSPVVLDSQVNSTQIWENWPSTWFHSQDSISSWLVSPHLPQEDHNNTELWLSQNLPNKCSMPRTWCALPIQDTEDIWLPQPCSEEECQPKKSMNKCWTFKTRTHHISSNGFQTTSSHQSVIFHQRDWRWLLLSLVTQLPSKKCSRESLNNSPLCSEEKLSYIGTLVKVWTKCNSLKPNPTWTISSPNINNIKTPLPKKKENSKKKKPDFFYNHIFLHKFFFFILIIYH